MVIKTTIQAACRKRGITTAYQLQQITGLYPAGAARLFNDQLAKVDLANLSRLITVLSALPEKKPKPVKISELFSIEEDSDEHKI
jgi:hypothetical protein